MRAAVLVSLFMFTACASGGSVSGPAGDDDIARDDDPADATDTADDGPGDTDDAPPADGDDRFDVEFVDDPLLPPPAPVAVRLVLNEVDCRGRDWIELAVVGAETFDAAGWAVTDNPADPARAFRLPGGARATRAVPLRLRQKTNGEAGFDFGIKCGSDRVYLLDPAGAVADAVRVPEIAETSTWGRVPDGARPWREATPTPEAPNRAARAPVDAIFDLDAISTIDLALPAPSLAALTDKPYDWAEAGVTVNAGGAVYVLPRIGVRLKSGLSFRPIDRKASFKLRFDRFDTAGRIAGLTDLNLNAMVDDPSMLREAVSYAVFRALDVPAARTGWARVRVNGADYGLYVALDRYDRNFADARFSATAHVYEGTGDLFDGRLADFDTDVGDAAERSDLAALIAAVNGPPEGRWAAAAPRIVVRDFVRFQAGELLVGQLDGYSLAANNYFLHADDRGVFTPMPWGLDRATTIEPRFDAATSRFGEICAAAPACRAAYRTAVGDSVRALDAVDPAALTRRLATVIASAAAADPKVEATPAERAAAVEALAAYWAKRRAAAVAWLAAGR